MENYLINKGYQREILISKNDDFKNESIKFLKSLEDDYDDFVKKWKTFEQNIKNDDYLKEKIDFEILSKKSPTTIIDAPWGTGKTYFIEEFSKLFLKNEIESKIFKSIIKIDVWKFSNSKDIPDEIMAEIF